MASEIIAVIFARGGSKGLPKKNILELGGKSLLARAIEVGQSLDRIKKVVISTDSEEIASLARSLGAEVPFLRPAILATDEAPEWLAWRHAVETLRSMGEKFDTLLSLPPTSPLRSLNDVECCLDVFQAGNLDGVITVRECDRNPYFNVVHKDSSNLFRLVLDGKFSRRQDAPTVYEMTTVAYVVKADFILSADRLFDGKLRAVKIPRDRAIDIDTPFDMTVAKVVLEQFGSDEPPEAL